MTSKLQEAVQSLANPPANALQATTVAKSQKRARDSSTPTTPRGSPAPPSAPTRNRRRIETVIFSGFEIQASFSSPYPYDDSAAGATASTSSGAGVQSTTTSGSGSGAREESPLAKSGSERQNKTGAAAAVGGRKSLLKGGLKLSIGSGGKGKGPREGQENGREGAAGGQEVEGPPLLVKVEGQDGIAIDIEHHSEGLAHDMEARGPNPPAGDPDSLSHTASSTPSVPLKKKEKKVVDSRRAEDEVIAGGVGSINGAGTGQSQVMMTAKRLFVCEGCFKYMIHPVAFTTHKKSCTAKQPPGKKVYQRGAHTIWEVDGAIAKLYCQNLCLFAKLFIEHKYMFFDVEGFMFYVLTDATPSFDYVLGYFSKEKISYDNYNLACIVTFPPYQKKGYGTLLIEFSYELSRRSTLLYSTPAGTPERPLSDLGLKGYLSYWTSVLVRYFNSVFEGSTEEEGHHHHQIWVQQKQKRKSKGGWEGEPLLHAGKTSPNLGGGRKLENGERGKREVERDVRMLTSIEEVAAVTGLRVEDVAFALVESGLAQWRRKEGGEGEADEVEDAEEEAEGEEDEVLVISKEFLSEMKDTLKVKPPILDEQYVLL